MYVNHCFKLDHFRLAVKFKLFFDVFRSISSTFLPMYFHSLKFSLSLTSNGVVIMSHCLHVLEIETGLG